MIARASTERLAVAVLALFATTVVPRGAYVVHHHAGDEHPHVHPFGAEPDDDDDHGTLEPRDGRTDDGAVHLEDPEVSHVDHVHWQQPFQRASIASVAQPFRSDGVVHVRADRPPRAAFVANVPAPARAPPPPLPTT